LRVTLHDGRTIIGTFLAFDKHLNLVLSEAEEFRTLRKGGAALLEERTEKRSLGLVLIRGENVVSLAVEGPPPPSVTGKSTGGGMARGRGAPTGLPPPPGAAPMGLGAAPVHGVGAPGMMPPPPPPPPGAGLPPPGMGRGMPPGY
jgi:small nuclear ribonucleoprotein B and B'